MDHNKRLMYLTLPITPLDRLTANPPLDPDTAYFFEIDNGVVTDIPSSVIPEGNNNTEINGWADVEVNCPNQGPNPNHKPNPNPNPKP